MHEDLNYYKEGNLNIIRPKQKPPAKNVLMGGLNF